MQTPLRSTTGTAERILNVAERLVQTRGFNGFSYADVAAELGITKASLHYHFPNKEQLGSALISRYRKAFLEALQRIDSSGPADPRRRVRQFVRLYVDVLRKHRMCLCGMLAADQATLPRAMRDGVREFFDANESWLFKTLEEGRKARVLRFEGSAHEVARFLVASLEGAMLVARSYGDVSRFVSASERLLTELGTRPNKPLSGSDG
jgi:TetR/AcrR family transcriptional regulator, transcriptional repressor for nem operon